MGLRLASPRAEPDVLYLWSDMVGAWMWWLRLQTQWRRAASGVGVGLDYQAVRAAFDMADEPRSNWPSLFSDLQAMESGAMQGCSETLRRK